MSIPVGLACASLLLSSGSTSTTPPAPDPSPPAAATPMTGPTADEAVPEVGAITSRPGFADAALVVPRGYVLTNVGLNLEGTLGGSEAVAIPDFMLRVGVADHLELRVGGFMATDGPLPVEAFAAAGVQVTQEGDVAPGIIALATIFLPPSPDLGGTVVEARLSGSKGFGDFGVNANVGMFGGPTTMGWLATAGAGYGIGGFSPFIEVYADGGFGPTTSIPAVGADAGFGYQITPNLAVDVSAGSVFLGQPDAFVSAGLSWLAH